MPPSPITISDDESTGDKFSEDNKVERYICEARFTDLLATIGPQFCQSDRSQQLNLANGMRFEAVSSFAAALSGSLAIRGLKIMRIPPQGPLQESVQALIQRFGFVSPDSGRHLMAAAHLFDQFVEEHLDHYYTGPRRVWTRQSEALLSCTFGREFKQEDTYWWRSQSSNIITGSNIARAGLAAHLYMTYEPFKSQSSAPATTQASLDVIFAVETLLGEIKRLRVQLLEHQRQLIMMSVDREIQLAAVYSAAYDGVAESASDAVHEIIGGLGVAGDREQVRELMRSGGADQTKALAAAISGTRAIRNEPLAGRWQDLCQAGALKNPSESYRRVVCSEDIPYWRIDLDTVNSTVTSIMAGTMLEAGVTHDDRTISGPLVFWWEDPDDRDFISSRRPGVARAALAAALYHASEVFQPPVTVPPGVVDTLEDLLGHTASLRAGLEENATLLAGAAERCKQFLLAGQQDVEAIMHHVHLPAVPDPSNHE
ncbi:unnamed protein product [Peniophora sp. CBMAI 1063]|nr:unnamed protein product [Peniophora sp. CBMAI 1063]